MTAGAAGAQKQGGSITVGLELDIPGFDPLKVGVFDTAAETAAAYIGRQIAISGSDLDAEFRNALLQLSKDITEEYSNKLNPDPAQRRYDDLTDHSRNDRDWRETVAEALRETQM